MATRNEAGGLVIGEVLKQARARRKLEIRTVEQQTKIRAKYLRALENEEWEVLPGPAYAKGFLRTYAAFLGLDGDALVDEYRRKVESSLGPDQPQHFAEPILERRLRPGEEGRPPWRRRLPVIAVLGAAAVVLIGIIGLIGGSGSEHHQRKGKAHGRHQRRAGGPAGGEADGSPSKPVTVSLVTHGAMEICLLPGHGQPLIDSQVLSAGRREGPFLPPADNYRLDLDDGGFVTVLLGGEPHPVRSRRPASYAIDADGIREVGFKGRNCP